MADEQVVVEAPGKTFRQHFVEVDGVRVGYWEAGTGRPLVMLPGSAGLDFSFAMDILSRDARVIAMDPPGWGHAPVEGYARTRKALADQMAAAVAAMGIDSYDVVGTSMGGSVALFMALNYTDRIGKVILDGPIEFRGRGHEKPRDLSKPNPDYMAHFFARRPWATPEFVQDQRERRARRFKLDYETGPGYDEALAERLKTLETPVLVLFGADDNVIQPTCGREYKAVLPNCDFIMIYDSNHDIQGDRPEAYAEVVGDFLRRGSPAFLFSERSGRLNP